MKRINKSSFLSLCKGSKLVDVQNIDCALSPFESTVFTYKRGDDEICKIETRSLKPNGKTTYAFYKKGA